MFRRATLTAQRTRKPGTLATVLTCPKRLAPTARSNSSLGQRPRFWPSYGSSAESATQRAVNSSIPHVSFIEFNSVSAQQLAILFLKCPSAMMLLLYLEVLQDSIELTRTDGKGCIPTLPEKAAITRFKRLDPFRGCFLYLFNHLGLGKSSWQCCDDVNVIRHPSARKASPPKLRQIVAR